MCVHNYGHQTYSNVFFNVSKSKIVSLENIQMGEDLVQ